MQIKKGSSGEPLHPPDNIAYEITRLLLSPLNNAMYAHNRYANLFVTHISELCTILKKVRAYPKVFFQLIGSNLN